jgi:hypothetical protein
MVDGRCGKAKSGCPAWSLREKREAVVRERRSESVTSSTTNRSHDPLSRPACISERYDVIKDSLRSVSTCRNRYLLFRSRTRPVPVFQTRNNNIRHPPTHPTVQMQNLLVRQLFCLHHVSSNPSPALKRYA